MSSESGLAPQKWIEWIVKLLIAEDDPTSRLVLRRTLENEGHEVVACSNGREALEVLRREHFDAILTDWMMPEVDGITVVKRVRAELADPPPILVVTALSSRDARAHALEAGADDYLSKPYQPREILDRLRDCVERATQPPPSLAAAPGSEGRFAHEPTAVCFAASTGGPEALRRILPQMETGLPAAYFLVMHGPAWMIETFTERIADLSPLGVRLAEDRMRIEEGTLYVAPGDLHMKVDSDGRYLRLVQEPPENFVRPAADPLLRSVAAAYGVSALSVVLTGIGRDATVGSQHVHAAGGRVLVQDPTTAVAPSMPRTVVGAGIADEIVALDELPEAIARHVREMSAERVGA